MIQQDFLTRFPELSEDVAYIRRVHQGQKRHGGSPYYLHPIAVAEIVEAVALSEGLAYSSQLRKGCLFHDSVEDNPSIAWSDLEGTLGAEVVSWLKPVTKVHPTNWKEMEHQDKLKWTITHYRALRNAPIESCIIKVADRIHNLSEMTYSSFWFQQNYLLDTTLLIGAIKDIIRPETLRLLELTFWKQSKILVDSV